jgi:hypothetical protein
LLTLRARPAASSRNRSANKEIGGRGFLVRASISLEHVGVPSKAKLQEYLVARIGQYEKSGICAPSRGG